MTSPPNRKIEKSPTDQRHELLKLQNSDPPRNLTDGDTIRIPVPSLEPRSPSAPAPADIDSSEDGSRIEGAPENLDVSSPTLCSCGTRINRERISSPYDSLRVVSQPMLPPVPAPAPAVSSCDVNRIGEVPENLDVPFPTMSVRIEYETSPPPSDFFSYGNNSYGVADDSSRKTRKRRRSGAEMDTVIISSNLNKGPSRIKNRHVCKINRCGGVFSTVTDLLRHTHHYHGLFKLRHYRLRKVPQCLICERRKRISWATPEDFTRHVYECLQRKREELGSEWEPNLQVQIRHYAAIGGSNESWYNQLEDSPTSFTEGEYKGLMQEQEDEESETDDPEESASDTEDDDELRLQTVVEDVARRVLISCENVNI